MKGIEYTQPAVTGADHRLVPPSGSGHKGMWQGYFSGRAGRIRRVDANRNRHKTAPDPRACGGSLRGIGWLQQPPVSSVLRDSAEKSR